MGGTISTMADTHFPARDRLNHSAALPPQYCYVPPTPNNFAPKGTIYDGYEAFKAQNTPALYRFSTTFQDRAAPEYPHSVEAHEDAIRKLQNDFSAVTGKSLRETSLRLADFTPLNAANVAGTGSIGACSAACRPRSDSTWCYQLRREASEPILQAVH